MRTGRSLTICLSLRGGGGAGPQRNQKKNQKKKMKKNFLGGNVPPDHPTPPPTTPDHTLPRTKHPPGLSPPLWKEWMTDRCRNITLATTSLRPVIIWD